MYDLRHQLLAIFIMMVSGLGILALMLWLWMLCMVSYAARRGKERWTLSGNSSERIARPGIQMTSVARRWAMAHVWHEPGPPD